MLAKTTHWLFATNTLLCFLLMSLCGCSTTRISPENVMEVISRVTKTDCQSQLKELVELGPRFSGDADQTETTLSYLENRLKTMGYTTYRESAGQWLGVDQYNLMAEIRGSVSPEIVIELGAHYDTVKNCVGADDNGTGVVGVLEAARVLKNAVPAKTVRFCFFAAEEIGLIGSRAHVDRITENKQSSVEGLINLEMIGYSTHQPNSQNAPIRIPILVSLPREGNFILVAGNFSSGDLGNRFESNIRRFVPNLEFYSANRIAGLFRDAARSDHSNYWDADIKSIMLTDTANLRNPNYHQPTDTYDTINFDFMSKVIQATVATMLEWGEFNLEHTP